MDKYNFWFFSRAIKKTIKFSIYHVLRMFGIKKIDHNARVKSRVYPLTIPLAPDEVSGWRPYPIFKGSTKSLQNLSCHVSTLAKGFIPHPPHVHKEEEILLLLQGEVDLIVFDEKTGKNNLRIRRKSGQCVYYPANFAHTLQTVSDEPANYLMFRWIGVSKKTHASLSFTQFDIEDSRIDTTAKPDFCSHLLFEASTEYLGKIHSHISKLSGGSSYHSHRDPYDVAIVVLEGEVETLGERVIPQGIIFYAAGDPHGIRNSTLKIAKYIVFEFHAFKKQYLFDISMISALKKIFNPYRYVRKMKNILKKVILYCLRRLGTTESAIRFKRWLYFFMMRRISFRRPRTIGIDASTICQLKCPACPTANGLVVKGVGAGFLRLDNFKKVIYANTWVKHVELSKWGEIFLNPELVDIMRFAYEKNIALTADNGVNFNTVSESTLESLVKYQFRTLSCSIDGASQATYSIYRVNGNYEQVIDNIRKLNMYKKKYKARYPILQWQFIPFGYNEHEILIAKKMAQELDMKFFLKLNWDDLYTGAFSPVNNKGIIRKESGLGVASRQEYEDKYGHNYIRGACIELWVIPRINFNGELLGCCINYETDYGNVFEDGLERCLNSEAINYARQMVLGLKPRRNDIPCARCKFYAKMEKNQSWIRLEELICTAELDQLT